MPGYYSPMNVEKYKLTLLAGVSSLSWFVIVSPNTSLKCIQQVLFTKRAYSKKLCTEIKIIYVLFISYSVWSELGNSNETTETTMSGDKDKPIRISWAQLYF